MLSLFIPILIFGLYNLFTFNKNEENILSREITALQTPKARYSPDEKVPITANLKEKVEGQLEVNYYHLGDLIDEETVPIQQSKEASWEWSPPSEDHKGYLVEVKLIQNDQVTEEETIAVDVSSSWDKFPRYGYLGDFHSMSENEMQEVIDRLNRHHINGIQFYDWHDTHHQPLKMENGEPAETWLDIANREVSLETIRNYIDRAHERNMNAMSYNLLYGALGQAEEDGVKTEWRLFKDQEQGEHDYHPLPEEWKSDVFLVDPGNEEWQQYINEEMENVFAHLPFNGWHIDQLGDRGDVYNVEGEQISLKESYLPFLYRASEQTGKEMVMNGVNQYGQAEIAQSSVPFLYTEVWEPYNGYEDLKNIIDENYRFSNGEKNTVLAAYMNYDLADENGKFNTPGVLMTDAVIFASGGVHIELGEHLLSKEYFPHKNLQITETLETSLTNYYDFIVAYENVLRDELFEKDVEVDARDQTNISHNPEQGALWTFSKGNENKTVVHLLNFENASHLEWNDSNGEQNEPALKEDVPLTLNMEEDVKRIWTASPDIQGGKPIDLEFYQENDEVSVQLPHLKYWSMLVVEH